MCVAERDPSQVQRAGGEGTHGPERGHHQGEDVELGRARLGAQREAEHHRPHQDEGDHHELTAPQRPGRLAVVPRDHVPQSATHLRPHGDLLLLLGCVPGQRAFALKDAALWRDF